MCPDCNVHVCLGQTTALCTPFPMLPMSFYLAVNFWHAASYAHVNPPLPSAQKHRTWKPLDLSHSPERDLDLHMCAKAIAMGMQ